VSVGKGAPDVVPDDRVVAALDRITGGEGWKQPVRRIHLAQKVGEFRPLGRMVEDTGQMAGQVSHQPAGRQSAADQNHANDHRKLTGAKRVPWGKPVQRSINQQNKKHQKQHQPHWQIAPDETAIVQGMVFYNLKK
jgi:hypothetical protein